MSEQGEKSFVFVLMGVSGCGKTTFAKKLSEFYKCNFIEGDDFHSDENKKLMKNGIPLQDFNRLPWLKSISKNIEIKNDSNLNKKITFVTCSALKKIYRDELRNNISKNCQLIFIHLLIKDKNKLKERFNSRIGHFMNENLIQSQLDLLEIPNSKDENVIELNVEDKTLDEIFDYLINSINNYFS